MHHIEHNEKDNYVSFTLTEFPNQCPSCQNPLYFDIGLFLLPKENDTTTRIIQPHFQTYYKCKCIDEDHAWLAYNKGFITKEIDAQSIHELIPAYELFNYSLLSDLSASETVGNRSRLYHHQHQQDSEIVFFRVPTDDILLNSYINNLPKLNFGAKENIRIRSEKTIELGISLSLLSIMTFHNPYGPNTGRDIYGNLQHWLGFETEIKDLLIYSGSPFWEHVKNVLISHSVITSVELIENHFSNIVKDIAIENTEKARHNFFAHFNANAVDQETKGYIETLYASFNKIVESFNNKFNKEPYRLLIEFDISYILPKPHTFCDQAFRSVLHKINEGYKKYQSQEY